MGLGFGSQSGPGGRRALETCSVMTSRNYPCGPASRNAFIPMTRTGGEPRFTVTSGLTDHYELEYRMLHKDGAYRWVCARVWRFETPAVRRTA